MRRKCRFRQGRKCSIDNSECPFWANETLESECESRTASAYNTFNPRSSNRAFTLTHDDPALARLQELLMDSHEEAESVESVYAEVPERAEEDQFVPIDMYL